MDIRTIRRVNFGVLVLGLLFEMGLLLWEKAISFSQLFNVITLEGAFWTTVPFVIMMFVAWFCASGQQVSALSSITSLIAALLLVGVGAFGLLNALVICPNAQSGIIFVLLPIVQFKVSVILGSISVAVRLVQGGREARAGVVSRHTDKRENADDERALK